MYNLRVQDYIVSKMAHQTEVHNQQAFTLEIKRRSEANLRHGPQVSSDGASKTETQGARGVAFRIMNGLANGAISDNGDVLEFLLHQQRQGQCLTRFCQAFLNRIGAWNGKFNLRVERNIQTCVFIVIEVDLKSELDGADTDSDWMVRFLCARQRELNCHLGRKLMTKDPGQYSIIGIDGKKIKCPEFF